MGRIVSRTNLKYQARKRNPNPNFLVRISSGRVEVFHVKGGMSFETQQNQTFWRDISGVLVGYPGGA